MLQDSQKLVTLKIELAAIVDWGEPFIKATYNLKGDGPLAFTCFAEHNIAASRMHYRGTGYVLHSFLLEYQSSTLL